MSCSVVPGPKAVQAADYGITAAAVTSANKEVEEYAAVVSTPQASIADRKSLTQALRDHFSAVEAKFMQRLSGRAEATASPTVRPRRFAPPSPT